MDADALASITNTVLSRQFEFQLFTEGVRDFFQKHPTLANGATPSIHSVKWRMKDVDHIKKKVIRKNTPEEKITPQNVFQQLTDIGGVRVLHLHQEQLKDIDSAIRRRVQDGDWIFAEEPRAYTWDPEAVDFMKGLGLRVSQKDSFYTSVHYVVRPRPDADVSCEIQVRTLFEEIWGEIDHTLNYPEPTKIVACKEQILVLAKLVGAGSRLVDALLRTHAAA